MTIMTKILSLLLLLVATATLTVQSPLARAATDLTNAAPIVKDKALYRHAIIPIDARAPRAHTTTTKPTSTATSVPTSTSSPIPCKANLTTCNFQGLPGEILNYTLTSSHTEDVLACQSACIATAKCVSYAWRDVSTQNDFPNCELFSVKWDWKPNGEDLVIKSLVSGIWYSDRWPGDGSEVCYLGTAGGVKVKGMGDCAGS